MITERRFSTPFKPQRRRRWARPALMLLLVAVVLWLMGRPSFAEASEGAAMAAVVESASLANAGPALRVLPPESVMAGRAWQEGIVIGFSFAAVIGFTFAAALKVKRDDEAAMEASRGLPQEGAKTEPKKEAWEDEIDPLSTPLSGIDVHSMIRITEALQKQTESAADWVRWAKATICRHEQEDMLRMALRELETVNRCMPELKAALQKQAGRVAL